MNTLQIAHKEPVAPLMVSPYIYAGLKHEMVASGALNIIKHIYDKLGADFSLYKSKGRHRENIVDPRYISFYILRYVFGRTFYWIGKLFEMNHTTVIHGVNKVKDEMDVYPDKRKLISDLQYELIKYYK